MSQEEMHTSLCQNKKFKYICTHVYIIYNTYVCIWSRQKEKCTPVERCVVAWCKEHLCLHLCVDIYIDTDTCI